MESSGALNFAGLLVERLGTKSALIDAATRRMIDAENLARLIPTYAASLIGAGLMPGDRILIGCSLSAPSTLVYLGAMYAGLVAVPVDERTLAVSVRTLIDATGARAVWTESGLSKTAGYPESAILLRGDLEAATAQALPPASRAASDLAVLMATSGSTGIPRFVKVSHCNLTANTEAIVRSQRLGTDERVMVVLPVSYCFGASLLHTHLWQGGSVVFDRRFMFPEKVLQSTAEFECTTFAGVPTVYNVLLKRSGIRETPLPRLRRLLQAGGGLASDKINELRAALPQSDFYVMYGQTEATARISCLEPERWNDKPGSVGRVLHNLAVSVVDEEGNAVPNGGTGELLVKGPSICSGYWNDPEESARVFCDGWLRTGDMARQDEDGYLWIEGRKSAFVKIRGTRVSLAEIEGTVASIPGVCECGAASVAHPESGEALVLFVVADRDARIDAQDIRRRIPPHWTVDSIRMIAELPKTSSGKLARPALSVLARESHAAIG